MANLKKLNNPCGIRKTSTEWIGEVKSSSPFCEFTDLYYGVRACALIISTYINKYKLRTVSDIINRYAPPSDHNDTKSYVNFIIYYTRNITNGSYILTPSSLIECDLDLILLILSIAKIESTMTLNYSYVNNVLSRYNIHVLPLNSPF